MKTFMFLIYSAIIAYIVMYVTTNELINSDGFVITSSLIIMLGVVQLYLVDNYVNFYNSNVDYFLNIKNYKGYILRKTVDIFMFITIAYGGVYFGAQYFIYGNVENYFIIVATLLISTVLITIYSYIVNYLMIDKKYALILASVITFVINLSITLVHKSLFTDLTVNQYAELLVRIMLIIEILVLFAMMIDKVSRNNIKRLSFLNAKQGQIVLTDSNEEVDVDEIKSNTVIETSTSKVSAYNNYFNNMKDVKIFSNLFMYTSETQISGFGLASKINDVNDFYKKNKYKLKSEEYGLNRLSKLSFEQQVEIVFKIASQLHFNAFVLYISVDDYNEELLSRISELCNGDIKIIKFEY